MKTVLRLCGVVLATLVLNACGAIPVSTDFDPEWRVPASPAYVWMQRPKHNIDPMIDNDLVEARIHRAVDEQLAARGFSVASSEAAANVLLTYHVGTEEKLDVQTFHASYGYYPCWNCWGGGFGYGSDVWVTQYTEGKLVIDMVDAQTKKLVWRGVAERRLPASRPRRSAIPTCVKPSPQSSASSLRTDLGNSSGPGQAQTTRSSSCTSPALPAFVR